MPTDGVTTDRLLSLLLGTDEEHGATVGDRVADEGVGRLDPTKRLFEVDDVDAVAVTVDEPLHLRVPAAGLVTEMDAGFEHLLHGDDCSHVVSSG